VTRWLKRLVLIELGFWIGFYAAAFVVRRLLPSRGGPDSDEVALVAVLDGVDLASRAQAFRGGTMFAWFGGVAVDLRGATLAPDAKLTTSALFGGVAIKVPPGWRIEHTSRAFAGGVAIDAPDPDDPDAPTLVVEATAGFGGVAIKAQEAEAVESS
jgi:hypothetical protein